MLFLKNMGKLKKVKYIIWNFLAKEEISQEEEGKEEGGGRRVR